MRPEVAIRCPFCEALGRELLVVAGEDDESTMLVHEKPACAEFDKMEPDEFMERTRLRMSN
jgi:hypothetical protein